MTSSAQRPIEIRPRWAWVLVIAAALIPFQIRYLGGGSEAVFAASDIPIILAIGFMTLATRVRFERMIPKGAGYVASAIALSIIVHRTLNFFAVGQKLFGFGLLLMYAIVFGDASAKHEGFGRTLLLSFVTSVVLLSAASVVVYTFQEPYLFGPIELNTSYPRLNGPIEDPNAFGGIVASAAVLLLAFGPSLKKQRSRLLAGAGLAVMILTLFLTYSRSAWIGAAAGVLYLAFKLESRRVFGLIGVVILLALSLLLLQPSLLQPQSGLVQRETTIDSRFETITSGLDALADDPLFGIGIGTSASEFGFIPHNTALWLLIEVGPLGLLAVLYMAFFFAGGGSKFVPKTSTEIATTASLIVMIGLSLGIEALYQRQLWLFVGVQQACRYSQLHQSVRKRIDAGQTTSLGSSMIGLDRAGAQPPPIRLDSSP